MLIAKKMTRNECHKKLYPLKISLTLMKSRLVLEHMQNKSPKLKKSPPCPFSPFLLIFTIIYMRGQAIKKLAVNPFTGCKEIDCLSGTVLYFSATKHLTSHLFTNVLSFHSQTLPDPIWHATYQSIQSIWWNSRPCLFHILNQAISISCSWHLVELLLDNGLQVLDQI